MKLHELKNFEIELKKISIKKIEPFKHPKFDEINSKVTLWNDVYYYLCETPKEINKKKKEKKNA